MSLPDGFADGQSVQALDENQTLLAKHGYGVVSGGETTIYSGNLGSGEATVEVASSTLLVDGVSTDVASDTVTIAASDTDPRKDLVVYDPSKSSGNRLTSVEGTAEAAEPTGSVRQQTESPSPPSLNNSVEAVSGSGDPKIPLCEVWVPADADSITSDDLFDRRQGTEPIVADLDAAERVGIPTYSADSNAPIETVYYNTDKYRSKYKDGAGVVHDPARTTLYMSDYVAAADRDGSVAIDTEFDAAISDAEAHDTIVFDDGTYQLNSSHTINKTLTIDSSNATLSCTNTSNNNPHIHFQGGGTGNNTTTSAAVDRGARVVPVQDPSIFSKDDRVLIMNNQYATNVDSKIQFASVEAVIDDDGDGTNDSIRLFGATARDFVSGAYVYVVDLLDAPTIKNLDTEGGGIRHLQYTWCEGPTYDHVSISEYTEISLYTRDCWKPRYRDVEATDPNGRGSGEGEPISSYRCSDVYIESPRVYDCRRGIDFAWGTHSMNIVDPVIQGFSIAGISIHGGDQADQMSIQGGTLIADPDGLNGNGIFNSEHCSTKVEGTTIIGRLSCIHNGGPITVSDVTLRPCSANASSGLFIKGSHADIENCQIMDPDGKFTQPVRIDTEYGDVEDVSIDANITYTGENSIYLETTNSNGQTIEGVTLRGNIRGGGTGQAIFLYPNNGTIRNVDCSVNVYGFTDQCVRLNGDSGLGAVKFHDCHMESTDKAAIYDRNALGSNSSVHISECTFETGSTSLEFADGVQNLWIVNNLVPGSMDTTGATNVHTSGNL